MFPAEIFDLIVDHLHDEPTALRSCCLISNSWISRARRHLFLRVRLNLHGKYAIQVWMKGFPDASNSPGHHTRTLELNGVDSTMDASVVAPTWVHHFGHIKELKLERCVGGAFIPGSLVQLCGLSPTLKSLRVSHALTLLSDLFNLICSFPLLEDLGLHCITTLGFNDKWHTSTSPRLDGSLHLTDPNPSLVRRLSDLQNGPNFAHITAKCPVESAEPVVDLISKCSVTLESLTVALDSPSLSTFPPMSANALPPIAPGLLDISKVTKLKHVEFQCKELGVQWIIAALRTVKSSTNLRKTTIAFNCPLGETTRQEWQDLDHLLVRLCTSRSICLSVKYVEIGAGFGELVQSLLPKFTSKGAVSSDQCACCGLYTIGEITLGE